MAKIEKNKKNTAVADDVKNERATVDKSTLPALQKKSKRGKTTQKKAAQTNSEAVKPVACGFIYKRFYYPFMYFFILYYPAF